MPRTHDRGGWPSDLPISRDEHTWEDWQWETQVLPTLLRTKGIMTVDELRRGIETIIPEQYESMLYHEKWIHSLETLLTEKGLITRKELDSATEKVKEKWG